MQTQTAHEIQLVSAKPAKHVLQTDFQGKGVPLLQSAWTFSSMACITAQAKAKLYASNNMKNSFRE